jgi:VWFA-related protein
MDRTVEYHPSVSLDFVDSNHVLLTFNRKQLLKRLPECPPDHQDRLMHAAILEIPSGKVVTEADWYLHDRRRYLWPLSPGKILLRRWNSLYVVDSSLHETLLLKSAKHLLWVSVTPDGSQIVVESENDKKLADSTLRSPHKAEPKYVVQFLDVKTLSPHRTLLFNKFTNLNGTSTGYADVVRKGDIWLLRFGPTATKRHNLARVRSQTPPTVLYPTENTLLIGRCATSGCNYGVTAFTLTGHRLWRQHWPSLRSYPEVTRSEDHSRFSVSTLRLRAAPVSPSNVGNSDDDPFQPQFSEQDVFQQEIQVFETASGTPVLSVSVSPAVVTGQNVCLSPDGRHLALLRGSALELFDLPPVSGEEQGKFASVKADTLGLYSLGTNDDADWWDTPPTASNSADADSATADAPAGDTTDETPASNATARVGANGQPAEVSPNSPTPSTDAEAAEKTAPPETPIFKVSTKAVVIDVVVTDAKGHPVRGLSQQDFQLTEDNKSQSVRYFREFSDLEKSPESSSGPASATEASSTASTSTTPPQTTAAPAPPPNVFNNRAHSSQEGAVTMVLFDTLNTPPQDQAYARLQLIKFLESKPKMSQFALCMLSSGLYPLRLIQGFTEEETLLLAAVRAKKGQPRNNRWQGAQTEARNSVTTVSALAQRGRTSGFQNLAGVLRDMQDEQFVTDTSERASRTIDAMMLLARYLSGISGRKNIVWLSASFPIAINLGPVSSNPAIDNPNYTYKVKRATNLLADAQVAVYPVDVRGLQVFSASSDSGAALAGPRSFQPPNPTSPNQTVARTAIPQAIDLNDQAAEQDTFTQFAVATGGKAFFNTNDIREAIATANEQGSNYYSFSYTSTNKIYDGKFRKIKVQFDHKGYKLYYRQGYFADEVNAASKEAQLARNAIATAMHYGSPPAREVQFSVRVWPVGGKKKMDRAVIGEVKTASKKKDPQPTQVEAQHYVVDYTLDGSALRFIPQQNGSQHNSLALMITSFNSDGCMLAGLSTRAQSDLQPEVYKKIINGEVGFQQEVDIPVEATSMRLGLQDQMSNHLGTVDVPLPVPPDPNAPRIAKNKLPEIEPD